MTLETYQQQSAIHRRLYESLREQICRDHQGKYIALAQGRLVAIAPTYDEARSAIEQLEPVPEYYLIFPAEMEPAFELAYDFAAFTASPSIE
jgi:hypothetical protein